MICEVCSEQVGDEKKYIVYITKRGQITLCTSCLTKGIRNGSGSIVSADGVISKPNLVFAGRDSEACEIAEDEGWRSTQSDRLEAEAGEVLVSEHWERAQQKYWFCGDGKWYKDAGNPPMLINDCFRRSCRNIRDYFGVWLKAEGLERDRG